MMISEVLLDQNRTTLPLGICFQRIKVLIFSCHADQETCWTIYPSICYSPSCWIKVVNLPSISVSPKIASAQRAEAGSKYRLPLEGRCTNSINSSIYIKPTRIIFDPLTCNKCVHLLVIAELTVFLSPTRKIEESALYSVGAAGVWLVVGCCWSYKR